MRYHAFEDLFCHFRYPAGERHVRAKDTWDGHAVIEARVRDFDDLGQLVSADRILARNGLSRTWFVPYFPFARHDRRNDALDGFELELALELVRSLDLVIADPHSDVAGQLRHIPQASAVALLRETCAFEGDPIVVIPDAGATKKAMTWVRPAEAVSQALKHRDVRTGRLSGFQVLADDFGGRPCVIVDDICDGGGTFLGLAAELRKKNAGPLRLAITHGLFTKGLGALSEVYASIHTFAYADQASAASPPSALSAPVLHPLPFRTLFEKGLAQ